MKKRIGVVLLVLVLVLSFGMVGCGAGGDNNDNDKNILSVDETIFTSLSNDYQAVEMDNGEDDYVYGYWHLYIGSNEDSGIEHYFTIYDNGAGNPGVCGRISHLDAERIVIEIDTDMFEQMPTDWIDQDGTLKLDYRRAGDYLIFTNNKKSVTFAPDEQ